MAKHLEIKTIDLLVDPFHYPGNQSDIPYTPQEGVELLYIWKGCIDKAAADPNRLLLIRPSRHHAVWQRELNNELEAYAKRKMGERFGFFKYPDSRHEFLNKNLESFEILKHFKINPKTVKTRGFGEYTTMCVIEMLTKLNIKIGLENPVPYRNRQSALLVSKSMGADFKPWKIRKLKKTAQGRTSLKKAGEKYTYRRREKAKRLSELYLTPIPHYQPRPHLMKKKRA